MTKFLFWMIVAMLFTFGADAASAQTNTMPSRFYFGPGQPPRGWTGITPAAFYPSGGYGYEPGATVSVVDRGGRDSRRRGYTTGRQPFLFSVALPEGNYRVTLTLGDAAGETDTTVRAEARRLMVEAARTQPGRFVTRTFTVNVRAPQIAGGGAVRLKGREQGPPLHRDWDEKLTLEFNGARPALNALEIRPDAQAATVYLAGDSTVTDQPDEPWCAWGQMLPRFFGPSVAVANYADLRRPGHGRERNSLPVAGVGAAADPYHHGSASARPGRGHADRNRLALWRAECLGRRF